MISVFVMIALPFQILFGIASALFGPFHPWSLARKLKLVSVGCGICLATVVVSVALDAPKMNVAQNGGVVRVLFSFSLMLGFLFVANLVCLTASHLMMRLGQQVLWGPQLAHEPLGEGGEEHRDR